MFIFAVQKGERSDIHCLEEYQTNTQLNPPITVFGLVMYSITVSCDLYPPLQAGFMIVTILVCTGGIGSGMRWFIHRVACVCA